MAEQERSDNHFVFARFNCKRRQYSYFFNGCQLQCVLLLTCRHVIHVLEGDHLLSHWLKVGRTLTQSTVLRFFERQQQNSATGKDGDPHRHITAELTTNVKIAVTLLPVVILVENQAKRLSEVI